MADQSECPKVLMVQEGPRWDGEVSRRFIVTLDKRTDRLEIVAAAVDPNPTVGVAIPESGTPHPDSPELVAGEPGSIEVVAS